MPQLKEFRVSLKNEGTDYSKGSNIRRVNRSGLLDPAFRDSSNGVSGGKSISMMNSELRSGSLGSGPFPISGSKPSPSCTSDPHFQTDRGLVKRNFATYQKFVSQTLIKKTIGHEKFTPMGKSGSFASELGRDEPRRSHSLRLIARIEDNLNSPIANSSSPNRKRHTKTS
jgi:hypothetical protein